MQTRRLDLPPVDARTGSVWRKAPGALALRPTDGEPARGKRTVPADAVTGRRCGSWAMAGLDGER